MVNWVYKGQEILSHDDLHPECTDFVYIITYTNGQKYVGKKAVRAVRRKPPLKGYKRNRRLMTNLPFVKYQGSHDQAKELEAEKKEILHQCTTRKTATYIEIALLIKYDALFRRKFINENISGTFYSNSLDGLLEEDKIVYDD